MNRTIKITGSRETALIDVYDIPDTTTEAQLLRHYLALAETYFPTMGKVRSVTFYATNDALDQMLAEHAAGMVGDTPIEAAEVRKSEKWVSESEAIANASTELAQVA